MSQFTVTHMTQFTVTHMSQFVQDIQRTGIYQRKVPADHAVKIRTGNARDATIWTILFKRS